MFETWYKSVRKNKKNNVRLATVFILYSKCKLILKYFYIRILYTPI